MGWPATGSVISSITAGGSARSASTRPSSSTRLRAEGHGVLPGATGENLTVRGIAWDAMTVGTRFRAGTVEAEVTAYANPCHNLRPYFVDGRFGRIAQKAHPGWSRVYARVLVEGEVVVGAAFELLAP